MSTYIITNNEGNEINRINSSAAFVEENYPNCHSLVVIATDELTAEEAGRMWRDAELSSSDIASQTPDWPNRDNILTYRTALRNWPSTSDFPDTRPTLGS
jgi:hypothetical protein